MTADSTGSDRRAKLQYPGGELDLDVVDATLGSDGMQLGSLLSETGMTTLDVGFVNTSACTSDITFIDGAKGILRHRGYPIDQLAEKASFLEVAYLLIHGEDPTAEQLSEFTGTVLGETLPCFFSQLSTTSQICGPSVPSLTEAQPATV